MNASTARGVQCVVFDVDDTLYLERDYVRSGFEAVGHHIHRRFGADGFFQHAWAAFEQCARNTVFNQVLADCGIAVDAELVTELVDVYRKHTPKVCLLPDAHQVIEQLHGRVALATITDGAQPSQQAKVDALGLPRWMDPIVITDRLGPGRSKPHPMAFELVEQATGCHGNQCVYIGDNPSKDFKAPHALGWRTVRIRRPEGLHCEVGSDDDVQLEVTDLSTLVELLDIDVS